MAETYKFCSGSTLTDVTVTMTVSDCDLDSQYNTTTEHIEIWNLTLSFTLSKALPTSLNVRYSYLLIKEEDSVVIYSGTSNAFVTIPANTTNYTKEVMCYRLSQNLSTARV